MTENDLATLGSVFLIEVEKIRPNSQQPRTEFDLEKIERLVRINPAIRRAPATRRHQKRNRKRKRHIG